MIEVKQLHDNTFEICWDKTDPNESIFNTWTEQDFTDAITNYLKGLENEKNV